MCKVRVTGGYRIKVRLDNRRATHTHIGGLYRSRNGNTAQVRVKAARGRVSATKALLWRPGYQLSVGIGELDGRGLGGGIYPSSIARC